MKILMKTVLIAVLFFVQVKLVAQDYPYIMRYGENDVEERASCIVAYAGGFIIGGHNENDILLIHVDANGDVIWTHEVLISDGVDHMMSMIINGDHLIAVGRSLPDAQEEWEGFVFDFDLTNRLVDWSFEAGPDTDEEHFFNDVLFYDSEYYVFGRKRGASQVNVDAIYFSLTTNGNLASGPFYYDANNNDEPSVFHNAFEDGDDLYINGRIFIGNGNANSRSMITKIDIATNTVDWFKYYFADNNDNNRVQSRGIKLSPNADHYLVTIGEGDDGTEVGYVGTMDSDGNTIGQVEVSINNSTIGTEVYLDDIIALEDGYIILGELRGGTTGRNHVIFELDGDLSLVWERYYDANNTTEDFFSTTNYLIHYDATTDYIYFVGNSDAFDDSESDILLYKVERGDGTVNAGDCSADPGLTITSVNEETDYNWTNPTWVWNITNVREQNTICDFSNNIVCICTDYSPFLKSGGSGEKIMNDYTDPLEETKSIKKINSIEQNNQIDIQPNPSTREFIIKNTSKVELNPNSLKIRNSLGREIQYSIEHRNQDLMVRPNTVESGIYFLNIYTMDGFKIEKKILIQ